MVFNSFYLVNLFELNLPKFRLEPCVGRAINLFHFRSHPLPIAGISGTWQPPSTKAKVQPLLFSIIFANSARA